MKYRSRKLVSRRNKLLTTIFVVAIAALVLFGGVTWYIRQVYTQNLRPVSTNIQAKYFTVEEGATVREVAQDLQEAALIRSSSAFEWYIRKNDLRDKIKAGTYSLNQSLSIQQIVDKMIKGEVARDLVTILPGKRLDQLKKTFSAAGYTDAQIEAALGSAQYRSHPALAELPQGATLEGFLYPDSYEKLTNTPLETIIKASLDEMAKNLTPALKAGFQKQGLTTFQAVTLASIIDQEVNRPADKPIVAQVFLKRYKEGMMLGSDVTAFYASAIAGKEPSVFIDSPYNTRVVKGLPPGPIGNVTILSLEAVANPAATDWLYFVAGDDGTTHYSRTQAEHEELTKKYCTKLCQ